MVSSRLPATLGSLAAASAGRLQHVRGILAVTEAASSNGWFGHVEPAAADPILGVTQAYAADPNPHKINLGVVRNSGSRLLCF